MFFHLLSLSNVYVATEDLDRLTSETKLWSECREFVAKEKTVKEGNHNKFDQQQVERL